MGGPTLSELRNRIAGYRQQVAAQQARVEQAEAFVKQAEAKIQTDFGIPAEQLKSQLPTLEAEIQQTGTQLDQLLRSVGA